MLSSPLLPPSTLTYCRLIAAEFRFSNHGVALRTESESFPLGCGFAGVHSAGASEIQKTQVPPSTDWLLRLRGAMRRRFFP